MRRLLDGERFVQVSDLTQLDDLEVQQQVRVAVVAGSATPPPPADPQASAAIVKKDCSDPKWQEENLGLWYSVCRQPLRW
jgi:hypothetical protein